MYLVKVYAGGGGGGGGVSDGAFMCAFYKIFCVKKFSVFFSQPDISPFSFVLCILYISMLVCIHVVSNKLYRFWNK